MKIEFEDHSYIEVAKSPNPGKIFITIVAKSSIDKNSAIANSVELTNEQFAALVKSLSENQL